MEVASPGGMRRLVVFAHDRVGEAALRLLLDQHAEVVHLVAVDAGRGRGVLEMLEQRGFPADRILHQDSLYDPATLDRLAAVEPDLILLAWWPNIIREPLISLPRLGVLNMHPSLLPHCRGKNPNFWAIVEQRPFGVTLHWVDRTVDGGDIAFQREIPVRWTDTGGSLHRQALDAMVALFADNLPAILSGDLPRRPQDKAAGSFHLQRELDPASEIRLEDQYSGRDLLNLLRARSYPPYPACWFSDGDETFEVRVEVTRK